MRRITTIFALSTAAFLSGCGGGSRPIPTPTTASTPTPSSTPNLAAGNWQFSVLPAAPLPAAPAKAPLTIAGDVIQTAGTINAAVHILGSSCFDRLTTVRLTGKATTGSVSLTSDPVDKQVVVFSGNFNGPAFTGTYKVNGGCAGGDQGTLTGINIPYIVSVWGGTFKNSANETFNVTGNIFQNANAGVEGSYQVTGDATFDGACFKAATVIPGAFPSGSFILGNSVGLTFETTNGTVTFVGTLSLDGEEISGTYSVAGGTCEGEGSAVLNASDGAGYWDY